MYSSPIMKRRKIPNPNYTISFEVRWLSLLNVFQIHLCFVCKCNIFSKFPQCLYMAVNRGTCQILVEAILINQSNALCLFNCQICIYEFRFSIECILCRMNKKKIIWSFAYSKLNRNSKELLMRTDLFQEFRFSLECILCKMNKKEII